MKQPTPFSIDVPPSAVADLHRRLDATRWSDDLDGIGWERGVPPGYLRDLASYWRERYDWYDCQRRLNRLPQYRTTIEGQHLHLLHVRSPHDGALPLLLLHGWPSSFVEFERVIAALTRPENPDDAFHLVVPSLPGFAFSTPLSAPGWGDLHRIAQTFAQLMRLLGYSRYAVQGGDIGAGVAGLLGMIDAGHVVGVHVNGPMPYPFGPPLDPQDYHGADRTRAQRFNTFREHGLGYLHQQATRPRTVGYGLHDSPVAQLAWIVEKFQEWTDPAASSPEQAIDRDHLLDNVSVYWFTGSGSSAAHVLFEGMAAYGQAVRHTGGRALPVSTKDGPPTAVAVFAADHSIRALLDPDWSARRWSEYGIGGHFPAMEVPQLYLEEIRQFFGELR